MELVPDPPETGLERALRLAAADPAARPAFYAALLDATVYAIGPPASDGQPAGEQDLTPGDRLRMITWERETGEPVVPFFTSSAALAKTLAEPATVVALPARALFEITAGAWLVLNPGLPTGKEFAPDEIAALLAGGLPHVPQQRVVEQDTHVRIGEPRERPRALLAALARFFAPIRNRSHGAKNVRNRNATTGPRGSAKPNRAAKRIRRRNPRRRRFQCRNSLRHNPKSNPSARPTRSRMNRRVPICRP